MKENILKILSGIRPEVDYTLEYNFIIEGLLDSLDIIRLIADIEEKFGVSVNGADILPENFESLDAIENLITKSS